MSAELEPMPDPMSPPRRRTWRGVAREAVLVLPNVAKLLARLARDPRVPMRRKVLAGAVFVYIVSPIDLIPDLIVGIGLLDDVVLAALVLNHLLQGAGAEVVDEHWDGSQDALDLVVAVLEWAAEIVPAPLRRNLPQ